MQNKILVAKKYISAENYKKEVSLIRLFLDRGMREPDLIKMKEIMAEIGGNIAVEIMVSENMVADGVETGENALLRLDENGELIAVSCVTGKQLSKLPDLSVSAFLCVAWYDPKYCIKEPGYCYFADSYEHIYRIHQNVLAQDLLNCFSEEYGHLSIEEMLAHQFFEDYLNDNFRLMISDHIKDIEIVTPFDVNGYVRQGLIKKGVTYSDGMFGLDFDLSEGFNAVSVNNEDPDW